MENKFTLQNRFLGIIKNIKNKQITEKYFKEDQNQLFNTVCLQTFQINNKNNNSNYNSNNNDDSIFKIFDTFDLTEALQQELNQQQEKIELAKQQFKNSINILEFIQNYRTASKIMPSFLLPAVSNLLIKQNEEEINQKFQETEQYAKLQQETTSTQYLYNQYKELIKHVLGIINNKNSFDPKTNTFTQQFSFTITSDNKKPYTVTIPAGTSLSEINEGYDMGRKKFKPGIQGLKVFCIEDKLNFILSFPQNILIEDNGFKDFISNLKQYFEWQQAFNKTSEFNFLKKEEFELLFKSEPLLKQIIACNLIFCRENKTKQQTPEFNPNDNPYYIMISER
jgi:hypothetical protein